MTLGYHSPMPPARTGVADYSAALVRALRDAAVDVAVNPTHPCDREIYHIGNNPAHAPLYARALDQYKEKGYRKSRATLEEYLRLYPKGEYADNAQYWIGETFYSEQDYERAALAFNDVLKKYPNGDKVSLAMLRLGFSFFEMKNYDLARTSLLKVIEKFPNTKQASVAKRKLLLIKAMTEQEKKTPAASGKPS